MKRKALCFILTLLAIAVFSLGCGGGGGGSNPASSNIKGQARVSGVVVDSSNNPVPNANVRLVLASNALINSLTGNTNTSLRLATTGNQTEFNTITNDKGEYTFTNVPYGEYTLTALTADMTQIVTRLAVTSPDVDNPKIILKPFGSIVGNVTDSSGNPVKGAIVCLEGTSYCAITGTTGSYELRKVPVDEKFNLSAMASGYTTKTNQVTINSSKDLELNSKNSESLVNISLTAINTDKKSCKVKCTLKGTGIDLDNLMVIAISSDGQNTYISPVSNGSAIINVTNAGTYSIIPACISDENNLAGEIKTQSVTDSQIKNGETINITNLTIDKRSSSGASNYFTLSGTIDNKNTTDSQFEVYLIDSTGHERKQTKSTNDLNFNFKNIPEENYKLVVCSDNSLWVSSNYNLSGDAKENDIGKITPVKVTPTITQSNGSATVVIPNSPSNEADNNKVYFSIYGFDQSSNPVLLYSNNEGSVDTTVYEFEAKSSTVANVSLDNLSADDTLGGVKFIYRNDSEHLSNKPIFEKMYRVDKGEPDYKKITLGSLKVSDNVIFFKPVNYNNSLYYLVVTTKETNVEDPTTVFVFNSKGEQKGSISLSAPVKYGNVSFVEDGNNSFLLAQYKGGQDLRMEKHLFSNILSSDYVYDSSFQEPRLSAGGYYQPYSVNKILAYENGKIFSVCDNYVLVYNPSAADGVFWTQVGFGNKDYESGKRVVAPFSTIVPSLDNKHNIYYINHEDSLCGGYKIYLGVSELQNLNTSTIIKCNYEIGSFLLNYDDNMEVNCSPESVSIGDSLYYYYTLLSNTNYPYTLTDCLDNAEASNKVFINSEYSWNNGSDPDNTIPKFVVSDTIYSGKKIESNYKSAGYNFDTWIERDSDVQILVLRNTHTYKENKIPINQVFNSSNYLESSIGYTGVNGDQIHTICADSNNNIQVMVLNCIDPDHKN